MEEQKQLLPFFRGISAFKDIGIQDNDLSKIIMQFQIKTFLKDDVLFSYGEEGDYFYIVLSGLVDLYLPNPESKKQLQEVLHSERQLIKAQVNLNHLR